MHRPPKGKNAGFSGKNLVKSFHAVFDLTTNYEYYS
jgi:hypothetical protein